MGHLQVPPINMNSAQPIKTPSPKVGDDSPKQGQQSSSAIKGGPGIQTVASTPMQEIHFQQLDAQLDTLKEVMKGLMDKVFDTESQFVSRADLGFKPQKNVGTKLDTTILDTLKTLFIVDVS